MLETRDRNYFNFFASQMLKTAFKAYIGKFHLCRSRHNASSQPAHTAS
jgi:hypothetical protein